MSEEDFRKFYDALAGRIYSYALQRLRGDSAKDVVNDTFEVVWRKRASAPLEQDACTAWIFQIAKNKILQEHQRISRKHHDNRFADDYTTQTPSAEDVADVVSDRDIGTTIYSRLRVAERELFDLLFIIEAPRSEISQLLGVSMGALNTRLSRLRDRLESLERELTAGGTHETEAGRD